jgi:hypothetical protein
MGTLADQDRADVVIAGRHVEIAAILHDDVTIGAGRQVAARVAGRAVDRADAVEARLHEHGIGLVARWEGGGEATRDLDQGVAWGAVGSAGAGNDRQGEILEWGLTDVDVCGHERLVREQLPHARARLGEVDVVGCELAAIGHEHILERRDTAVRVGVGVGAVDADVAGRVDAKVFRLNASLREQEVACQIALERLGTGHSRQRNCDDRRRERHAPSRRFVDASHGISPPDDSVAELAFLAHGTLMLGNIPCPKGFG